MSDKLPTLFAPPATAKVLNKTFSESTTHLYRHFDAADRLLYVGVSLSGLHRLAQHRERSHWFDSITSVTIEKFASRKEALQAETHAIQNEGPLFNIQMAIQGDDADQPSPFEMSRSQILAQIVPISPIYSILEASHLLRTSFGTAQRLVKEGKIGSIKIGRETVITGWQILEFIEFASITGRVE